MNKKRLLTSLMSIAMLVSITTGATYALFTAEDSVNIAVTSARVSVEAKVLDTLKLSSLGEEQTGNTFSTGGTATLSENGDLKLDRMVPGDRVDFQVQLINKSNVNVAYKLYAVVTDELSEVLEFSGINAKKDSVWTQLAYSGSEEAVISTIDCSIELPEEVGNEYQNKNAKVTIVLEAVQGNGAGHVTASTVEELKNLLSEESLDSKIITLSENLKVTETLPVKGKVVLNLSNSATLDNSVMTSGRLFKMETGSSLEINAEGVNVALGGYGLVEFPANTTDSSLIVNGGTYTGDVHTGAFIRLRSGNNNINVSLNDINVDIKNSYVISTAGVNITDCLTLSIDGGSYFGSTAGFELYNTNATINNAEIKAGDGFGIMGGSGTIDLFDTDIYVSGDGNYTSSNCLDAGLAISGDGTINMTGGSITMDFKEGNDHPWNLYALLVCTSGGIINTKDVIFNLSDNADINQYDIQYYPNNGSPSDFVGRITIDGTLVSEVKGND